MKFRTASGVILFSLIAWANAVPTYRALIPNAGVNGGAASRVPAPFTVTGVPNRVGETCASIGHADRCTGPPSGGGNPFGQAFVSFNPRSFANVCWMDSDGDGVSNGKELGDPHCTWTPGAEPNRTMCLSHPGFACSTPTDPHCQGWASHPQCAAYGAVTPTPTTAATTSGSSPPTTNPQAACPAAASAATDDERYRAYQQCWINEFARWQTAFNAWLANGGAGCPTSPTT